MNDGFDIPLSLPDISDLEVELVADVLRSGRLSIGPMLDEFEELVAAQCGAHHGVGVSSGTSGLHLALLALGIGPGDEVITTPFSFIASANVILYVGATPVFVDIDPVTLNMDPKAIEPAITANTKAILAVEAFGNPAGMPEIAAIAHKHEVPLIEDACEGFGGAHQGRSIGSFGRVGVFAFYPNKQITTGEGGMIVTDDERLANMCRSLRNHGRPAGKAQHAQSTGGESWHVHERLGYNYRMSELHAALGVAQMRRCRKILERRSLVASKYMSRLMGVPDLVLPNIDPRTTMSWFVFVVRLAREFSMENRDRILAGMRRHDVGVSNYFPPIHLQRPYREEFSFCEGDYPVTESVSARTIALPFHANMTDREIDLVCQTLEVMIQRERFSMSDRV